MNSFKVSYITTLPKEANAPMVTIMGDDIKQYRIEFNNGDNMIASGTCMTNHHLICSIRQWYTPWSVSIYDDTSLVYKDVMDLRGKVVFIKIDAYALGDTIAWIPYVEAFRLKHGCRVICSTFHNDLLVDSYPEILFAQPNTQISNIYAQYYIGAANDGNLKYSPILVNEKPLQMAASSILGLDWKEIRPNLVSMCNGIPRKILGKYVTLSEYGSHVEKHWKAENGWQEVVDYLKLNGYEVVIISKEKSSLSGIIDLSNEPDLRVIASYIKHGEFHLGVSSGLSWLAWGLGKKTIMVSDVTPNFHEFFEDNIRINANELSVIDYSIEEMTNVEEVIRNIGYLIV